MTLYDVLDIYYTRPDNPAPVWGFGIVSAVVGLVLLRSYARARHGAEGKEQGVRDSLRKSLRSGKARMCRGIGRRTGNKVTVIGTVVFLIGFGSAFWAGYQAHDMINYGRVLDQEYDAYQGLTIIGLIVASVGIGIVTYGLVFGNLKNDAGKIPKSAGVIGAIVSAFGFGTMCWAGLRTQHMEVFRMQYEAEYDTLVLWTIVGMVVGSLGLAVMIYGLSSNPRHDLWERQRRKRKGI